MKLIAASCTKHQDIAPQTVWADIQAERPDVLLLHGDNVYLQHNQHDDPLLLAAELRSLYAQQFAEPAFAALLADLRARGGQLAAIYDDHDFLGDNRCGGDVSPALREAARGEFIRAFGPPLRAGSEVYRVLPLGLVDLVVLDGRFHRSSLATSRDDRDAMLGSLQWRWLENTLAASIAPYLVLASATTLHDYGSESWEHCPAAFSRLTGLLKGRPGALVIAGDVHRNAAYDDSGVIEIVTSAVARRGMVFGAVRQNYAVLSFDAQAVRVELRCLKVGGRFDFNIPLARWALP
ncbi:MAG TPA: alkaline phosphatase D family protein [Ideonella sp.]|nr:alkaline phosphatase D family protein [Ideonella sp.]